MMYTINTNQAPKCTKCSYSFADLTTLERCPECGASVLESLAAEQHRDSGRRITSSKIVWGLPLYEIVTVPGRLPGSNHARGWIAIGPKATGVVAIGAYSRGIISIGAMSFGGISLGAMSIGILSLGSMAIGGITTGAVAIGAYAQGVVSVGVAAQGNVAIGVFASGKIVIAPAEIAGKSTATMSANFFDSVSSVIGGSSWGPIQHPSLVWAVIVPAIIGLITSMLVCQLAPRSQYDTQGDTDL